MLKPDGEDWLIKESLVDGIDEWWDDMVDGEGGESKSEDSFGGVTLEIRRDMSGDSESGGWDWKLLLSGGSEGDGVLSQESLGVSGSVLDGPLLSVALE